MACKALRRAIFTRQLITDGLHCSIGEIIETEPQRDLSTIMYNISPDVYSCICLIALVLDRAVVKQ